MGVELVTDKESKTPLENGKVAAVVKSCMKQKVIIGRNTNTIPGFNNVLILCPPLIVTRTEVDRLAEALHRAIFALPT